jgi:hypothetical protein
MAKVRKGKGDKVKDYEDGRSAKGRGGKRDKHRDAATKAEKKSDKDIDSSRELEAVKSKKGEPSDNLRQRAEWFQKRRS